MSGKSGSAVVAIAISTAIVCALILEPGILANTPNGSPQRTSKALAGLGSVAGYPPFGMRVPVEVTLVSQPSLGPVAPAHSTAAATPAPKANPPKAAPVVHAPAWLVAPIVTWYGPGFYGRRTACGQAYSRYIVGVASRTLPCGTLVRFRWHGITRVAPVIDRGPYASSDYVFDFSAALACDLFQEAGQRNGCYTRYNVQWRVIGRRHK